MSLSNDGFVAFHYRSYGTFFYNKIDSMIPAADLPTTDIIEPVLPSTVRRLSSGWGELGLVQILRSYVGNQYNQNLTLSQFSHCLE